MILIQQGVNPFLATLVAMIAGALAGGVTAFLMTVCKIPSLLAGILTMTSLLSINLRVMGKANITLLGQDTIFSVFQN